MFKTDILVNCTSVGNSDYIPNIENILPPTPIDKININSYFELGTNIGTYYFYYEISDFDVFKPNIEAKAIKPLPSDF
jgi:hypothetical protein